MTRIELTGLDGSNPLAFFAALGVLTAVETAEASSPARPTLRWVLEGVWRPVLESTVPDVTALVELLDRDRQRAASDPALRFSYTDGSKSVPDVKPSPDELRRTLTAWVADAAPFERATLDWFTGFIGEGATDNNGRGKPSALHFTAGQQKFLKAACDLADGVKPEHLEEALVGPWSYSSTLPVMGWDNTETRDYALRARNPSTDKKQGNPGADWLALRGLTCLPNVGVRGTQLTTGYQGSWKNGTFAWPLWDRPAHLDIVRSLLATRGLRELTPAKRARRGVVQVFQVRVLRSDQGGYGSVTAAAVV